MSDDNHCQTVAVVGPLPPFGEVAEALWGANCDVDADGDSDIPESTTWRELTLILRPAYLERIDIDPTDYDRDTIKICATSEQLLSKTVSFLSSHGSIR